MVWWCCVTKFWNICTGGDPTRCWLAYSGSGSTILRTIGHYFSNCDVRFNADKLRVGICQPEYFCIYTLKITELHNVYVENYGVAQRIRWKFRSGRTYNGCGECLIRDSSQQLESIQISYPTASQSAIENDPSENLSQMGIVVGKVKPKRSKKGIVH